MAHSSVQDLKPLCLLFRQLLSELLRLRQLLLVSSHGVFLIPKIHAVSSLVCEAEEGEEREEGEEGGAGPFSGGRRELLVHLSGLTRDTHFRRQLRFHQLAPVHRRQHTALN